MGTPAISLFLTAAAAGALGAAAMGLTMWLICRSGWAHGNMVVAIGSLVTKKRDGAGATGTMLHALSAFGFALLYTFAMRQLGLARFPASFFAGAGFGVMHGLIVSLLLVWIVAEQHPLEEFQDAGLAVGVSHFAGHVAYGAAVGLVVGLVGS